jgi:RHS repeat-associated protein
VNVFSGTKVIADWGYAAGCSLVPASLAREHIYAGSSLLAKIEGGVTKYYHQDHLSNRVITDTNGSIVAQSAHFPFGENWYGSSATTRWKFTSYERDSESSNDYAMARYHVSRLGRFSSPDPELGDISNPQRLNRYAYALNDPINLVDPLGRNAFSGSCIYLTNDGYGIESIDSDSDPSECQENGGFWSDGTAVGVRFDPNSDEILILSAQIDAFGNVQYGWTQGGTLGGIAGGTWAGITQWIPAGIGDPAWDQAGTILGQDPDGDIGILVRGLNALSTPLQNTAISAAFFITGAGVAFAGTLGTVAACSVSVPACALVAPFTVGTGVFGGGALMYFGYVYTRDVTLPSYRELYRQVVPRR